MVNLLYDPTAGLIETPDGRGKFIAYDNIAGIVYVEMDNRYVVFYPASECYIINDQTRRCKCVKNFLG